jgi:1,4-alpha-glucan branching enzyme
MAGTRLAHSMPFGAEFLESGVRFRLWAPDHECVRLALDDRAETFAMHGLFGGWHELVTDRATLGTRYRYILPNGSQVPDPASRFQPEDVHGPSQVIDPRIYEWRNADWRGRPWHQAVIYELHIGRIHGSRHL